MGSQHTLLLCRRSNIKHRRSHDYHYCVRHYIIPYAQKKEKAKKVVLLTGRNTYFLKGFKLVFFLFTKDDFAFNSKLPNKVYGLSCFHMF